MWSWVGANESLRGMYDFVRSDQEITPPLYTAFAWLSVRLGDASTLIRLPSVLAGIATIPLVYAIALRTLGRRVALTAALLTAISPFLVYYSVEGRAYALATALVAASTLAMLIAIEGGGDRRRWWLAYAAFSCAAMLTHYTALYVLAVQFAWIVWFHPDARRPALLANVAAAAVFLLWLPGFLDDLASPTRESIGLLVPFSFPIFHTYTAIAAFGNPGAGLETFYGIGIELVLFAGLAVGAAGALIVLRGRRSGGAEGGEESRVRRRNVLLFVALGAAAPVGLAFVSLIGDDQYFPRNLATSAPAFLTALAALLCAGPRRYRVTAVALVVAVFAVGTVKTMQPRWQRADVRSAAQVIDAEADPDDVVIDAVWLGGVAPESELFEPLALTLDVNLTKPHDIVDAASLEEIEGALSRARGRELWLAGNPALTASVVEMLDLGDLEPSFSQSFEGVLPTVVESYAIPAATPAGDGG